MEQENSTVDQVSRCTNLHSDETTHLTDHSYVGSNALAGKNVFGNNNVITNTGENTDHSYSSSKQTYKIYNVQPNYGSNKMKNVNLRSQIAYLKISNNDVRNNKSKVDANNEDSEFSSDDTFISDHTYSGRKNGVKSSSLDRLSSNNNSNTDHCYSSNKKMPEKSANPSRTMDPLATNRNETPTTSEEIQSLLERSCMKDHSYSDMNKKTETINKINHYIEHSYSDVRMAPPPNIPIELHKMLENGELKDHTYSDSNKTIEALN